MSEKNELSETTRILMQNFNANVQTLNSNVKILNDKFEEHKQDLKDIPIIKHRVTECEKDVDIQWKKIGAVEKRVWVGSGAAVSLGVLWETIKAKFIS